MDRNFRGLRRKFTISVISDFTCTMNVNSMGWHFVSIL
jgi:hypothetical protein